MSEMVPYVAVKNRKADLTGSELAELAEIAKEMPDVTDVKVKKSNVTFRATPEAMKLLWGRLRNRIIIEVNKNIYPLS